MHLTRVSLTLLWIASSFALWVERVEADVMDSYCKPGEDCWPTDEEVAEFKKTLSPTDTNCFSLPTFASLTDQGVPFKNPWGTDPPMLTPYQLYLYRNQINDWTAYFVVMARNESDVSKAVQFAANHSLSIGVISTGHEFNDRNSGPSSLQIRTTCLTGVEFDLDSGNRFGHADGIVRLGSGMTWGTSRFGLKGVQEYAAEVGRVVVSGHAGQVGVVGWTLGGGHGQLAPLHGLGVDQLLEVELVVADGSHVTANAQHTLMKHPLTGETHKTADTGLFWALRGGGGSTWGVITSLTVKVHKPRNSCSKGCYTQWNSYWVGDYTKDAAMAPVLIEKYFDWASRTSKYWSSYASLYPKDNTSYIFSITEALYVGKEEDGDDFFSFNETFHGVYPDNRVWYASSTFDTFWDKLKNQTYESLTGPYTAFLTTVLLNSQSLRDKNCAKTFHDNWLPRCATYQPCVMSWLFMHTLSRDSTESDSCLSDGFRTGHIHASSTSLFSLNPFNPVTTRDQQNAYIRSSLAPAMYKWGDYSYFSESQYSMNGTQWKHRFWGEKNYQKLLKIKRTWDPTNVFGCRHCVGDDEEQGRLSESTMPPWRSVVKVSKATAVAGVPTLLLALLVLLGCLMVRG